MPKWTDYTIKTNPADNDEVMVLDTAGKANKRLGLSVLSDWILSKLADKVFQKLETSNKTVLGAINELNSNKVGQNEIDNVYVSNVKDLNNPPGAYILNTGTNPIGLPPQLRSNGCLVIQHNPLNSSYSAQIAFSFGSDQIAIRRKSGTDSWSEWKYFTAQ